MIRAWAALLDIRERCEQLSDGRANGADSHRRLLSYRCGNHHRVGRAGRGDRVTGWYAAVFPQRNEQFTFFYSGHGCAAYQLPGQSTTLINRVGDEGQVIVGTDDSSLADGNTGSAYTLTVGAGIGSSRHGNLQRPIRPWSTSRAVPFRRRGAPIEEFFRFKQSIAARCFSESQRSS